MTRIAYPFLRMPDAAVNFGGWFIGDPGTPLLHLPEVLDDWDYARDLAMRTHVAIDWPKASEALGFSEDDWKAVASLTIGTGQGHLPRSLRYHTSVHLSRENPCAEFELTISAQTLSAKLFAKLDIVLSEAASNSSLLSPRDVGSRLWNESAEVILEGGGASRFPTSSISFKSAFAGRPHEFSTWYLDWRPEDLLADFSSSVVLYVNSDDAIFLERFTCGDKETVQGILGAVAFQMCSAVLALPPGQVDFEDIEEGSVIGVIYHWLRQAFPRCESASSLRGILVADPGSFNAALIAAADVGGRTK